MTLQSPTANVSDEELCVRLCGGDVSAGESLIERYVPLVHKRAGTFREKGVENDDLIQEGLIGLLDAVRAYDGAHGASFATFAYRCVTNRLLNCIAAASRGLSAISYESWQEPCAQEILSISGEDPQEILIHREQTERWLHRASDRLSDFEQASLRLYLSGYTYYEIAASLQSTAKAVDNALQRVRRKLRAD